MFAASKYFVKNSVRQTIVRAIISINTSRVKHAVSRIHGMLFFFRKKVQVFKNKCVEYFVLCDITENSKERQFMCLQELEIHRRVLNAQRVFFSVVLASTDRPGRRARTIQSTLGLLYNGMQNCVKATNMNMSKIILMNLFNINSLLTSKHDLLLLTMQGFELATKIKGQNNVFCTSPGHKIPHVVTASSFPWQPSFSVVHYD